MQKESYFTLETIEAKSSDMLASLASFRKRHENISFDASRAALLVLDMQEYFLRADSHAFIPSAPAIIPNIQSLIKAFHARGYPVIFTRHINTDDNAGMMSLWWKDVIRAESRDSEIIKELDCSDSIVIHKSQYDAFYNSSLEQTLREHKIEQVIITGVMTHLCCETTARSAFIHGFQVFFTMDGTATYNETFHRAALLNLSHGFAFPVLTKEIMAQFVPQNSFCVSEQAR